MERFTIVGTQVMNFTTRESQKIDGVRIYVTGQGNSFTKGIITDKFFCNSNHPDYSALCSTEVPIECDIEFSRRGYPTSYKLIQKGK